MSYILAFVNISLYVNRQEALNKIEFNYNLYTTLFNYISENVCVIKANSIFLRFMDHF